MNDLVILKKDDVFTTSKVIADGTGIRHNKLINTINKYTEKVVGIKNRDEAHISQLNTLSVVEAVMGSTIRECITNGIEYHEIYKVCQKKLEVFSNIMYLEKVS